MAQSISFTEFDLSQAGHVSCTVTREGVEDELWFDLPFAGTVAPDLLAAGLATLCGTVFDRVEMDLPLGPDTAEVIRVATRSELVHRPGRDIVRRKGRQHALNFSGGFDSLAARAVLPDCELISLDFGGRFSRERPLFERFSPHIVKTNLVDLKLNRNGWSFMGIGSILLRDELDLGVVSFGSIQAGSLPRLFTGPSSPSTQAMPSAPFLQVVNPVSGVSEVGAMMITARAHPDALDDILASVAHPGEMKHYRKRLMLEAVSSRLGLTPNLSTERLPTSRPTWGSQFADDLSALYMMKVLGTARVVDVYDGGVPDTVLTMVEKTELTFFERFNPHAFSSLHLEQNAMLSSRLIQLGIVPYERTDWHAASLAMKAIRGQL